MFHTSRAQLPARDWIICAGWARKILTEKSEIAIASKSRCFRLAAGLAAGAPHTRATRLSLQTRGQDAGEDLCFGTSFCADRSGRALLRFCFERTCRYTHVR